jgi:short subunit fatty acids transporter
MRWMSFIQWGFLLFIVAIFIFFKEIHLQVSRYNLFLVLLISCAYIVILSIWILERKRSQQKESDSQEQHNDHP